MSIGVKRSWLNINFWVNCSFKTWGWSFPLNLELFLCRTGHVPSAVGCVTAVCVVRRRAAVLPATWWGWPATTATTTSTSIWRGVQKWRFPASLNSQKCNVYFSVFSDILHWSALLMSWEQHWLWILDETHVFCLSCLTAFRRSWSEVQREKPALIGSRYLEQTLELQYCRTHFNF